MIDGTCAHGEALTDGCEECNDAVKARVASRPACPLGVTEDHFCDAVTCNTPVEQLRREAVVSRDLTRRFQAAASKHVAMLWSLDAAQAVEKLLGLLIEHDDVLRRFVIYANGKGPALDSAYVDILDAALALIQRMPVGISVTEQSYRAQCAALEKTVKALGAQVAELRSEVARLEAAVKDRDAMISEAMAGSLGFLEENAKLEAEVERIRGILTDARETLNGGESSEADFVDALARYMAVSVKRDQRFRDDVGNWQRKAEGFAEERDEANRLLGEMTEVLNRTVDQRDSALESPVPMVLFCPECTERHIDAGEFAEKPHHTHACQSCGFVWRPAVVATVGVRFLPGFRDAEVAVASSRLGMSTAKRLKQMRAAHQRVAEAT